MEQHRLAGFDERERGFNRLIAFEQADGGVRAILRYETRRVVTAARETPETALNELIRALHEQGYSQLRSQLSVRDDTYLGSQEPWIEYPDPERQAEASMSLIARLLGWLRRPATG